MSKQKQLQKNLKLSEKLADFIAENPHTVKNLPKGASFVAFSSNDDELNKLNEETVESLKKEGKQVVKAVEKKNETKPWIFIPAFS